MFCWLERCVSKHLANAREMGSSDYERRLASTVNTASHGINVGHIVNKIMFQTCVVQGVLR